MTAQKWDFDSVHSSVNFTVRHLMVSKVRGVFDSWKGNLFLDDADLTQSHFDVEIDLKSVNTKEPKRDDHLRSGDFFEIEKYPTMTFKSTKVEKAGDAHYKVTGDLTLRGVTHPVTLDVEDAGRVKDPWGGERAGFSANTSISREKWGVKYNAALEAGGVVIGDKVDIHIEIEAIRGK
jgi:polyisoprenoid-binding protein YceI